MVLNSEMVKVLEEVAVAYYKAPLQKDEKIIQDLEGVLRQPTQYILMY